MYTWTPHPTIDLRVPALSLIPWLPGPITSQNSTNPVHGTSGSLYSSHLPPVDDSELCPDLVEPTGTAQENQMAFVLFTLRLAAVVIGQYPNPQPGYLSRGSREVASYSGATRWHGRRARAYSILILACHESQDVALTSTCLRGRVSLSISSQHRKTGVLSEFSAGIENTGAIGIARLLPSQTYVLEVGSLHRQ